MSANFRSTFLAVSITLLLSIGTFGQNTADSTKSIPAFITPGYVTGRNMGEGELDLDTWTDQTAQAINKARPGAYTPNPPVDRAVIRSVYKSMKVNKATTGLSNVSILHAIYTAWINLAVKPFDRTGKESDISEDDITNAASAMREVVIQTEPIGATIMIDGYRGYGLSNTRVFMEPRKVHTIRVNKVGYVPEEQPLIIEPKEPGPIPWLIKLKAAK